jgi:cytochrome c oxidase subunit 2
MEDTRNSELSIRVTGYQWKWQYQYMDAGEGVNFFSTLARTRISRASCIPASIRTRWQLSAGCGQALVIPSGTKVRLLLTSQDVIHAWWVPDFGAKRSAIPGFVNELWFKVDPARKASTAANAPRCAAATTASCPSSWTCAPPTISRSGWRNRRRR